MQFLVALFDRAFTGELAQHALELGAHGVLEPEGAGDFAGADLAGPRADEGEDVSFGGEGGRFGLLVQNGNSGVKKTLLERNVVIESGLRQPNYSAALVRRAGLALAATTAGFLALPATGFVACAADFACGAAGGLAAALPDGCLRPAARRPFGELPMAAARASSRTIASSSVTLSGVLSPVSVALTPLWLT